MSSFPVTALPDDFFVRPVDVVARELLGKILTGPSGQGQIVEVEAYGGRDDPASHAFRGPTKRSQIMFLRGGVLYTYFIYGMYWCANVVTGESGVGSAVLIRALAPCGNLQSMFASRPHAKTAQQLTSGPGKLCQALGIDGRHNGQCLLESGRAVQLGTSSLADEVAPNSVRVSARIGIRQGNELPWRYYVADDQHVSRLSGGSSNSSCTIR